MRNEELGGRRQELGEKGGGVCLLAPLVANGSHKLMRPYSLSNAESACSAPLFPYYRTTNKGIRDVKNL